MHSASPDKKRLRDAIIRTLSEELHAMVRAANAAREAATHEESKPEDEHDTRGLEASYLAGAQAERAQQIQAALHFFEATPLRDFSPHERIQPGALVAWKNSTLERITWGLILKEAGGTSIQCPPFVVQIISPASPLGEALLDQKAGDNFELETARGTQEFEILSVQ